MLNKDICQRCVSDFSGSWSNTRDSFWNMGAFFCIHIRENISLREIPKKCRYRVSQISQSLRQVDVDNWCGFVDEVRNAAWGCIKERRDFFKENSFNDIDAEKRHILKCFETGENITLDTCYIGHKIHFFELVDLFLTSFDWDFYENLRTEMCDGKAVFIDEKISFLWKGFYKQYTEFGTHLLSRNGVRIRDEKWKSRIFQEKRDHISVVIMKEDMPYRYLIGESVRSEINVKLSNKKYNEGEIICSPSPLANPFEDGKDENKSNSIYRRWLLEKIRIRDLTVFNEIVRLYLLVKDRGELILSCCDSKYCHGEVVKYVLENLHKIVPESEMRELV